MKSTLLQHILCSIDSSRFALDPLEVRGDEIVEGRLTCQKGHAFSVTRSIPRLIVPGSLSEATEETRVSFTAKWKHIPHFGFDGASRSFYNTWYLQRYGFESEADLHTFLGGLTKILDAGTGLGRDVYLYARNTRGLVFALDISDSIDLAYEHVGHLPNVHLVQADLRQLPFPEAFFDFVACEGVLHHTVSTEGSFKYLARYLAPGGQIAAYIYKKKGPIREFADDYLRAYYTKSRPEVCYEFAKAMTALGKALCDLKTIVEIPEDIPILGIRAGSYDIHRFIYYNVMKCYWNEELDYETNVMTNFDWYHPVYAHRHTGDEVREWCQDLGLSIIHFDLGDSGISVRARRNG